MFNSKHHNHKANNFNSGGERFKRKENEVPGPGRYNTVTTELSKDGKYSVSNLQYSKVRTFGHDVRRTFANRCQSTIYFIQLPVLEITRLQVNSVTMLVEENFCAANKNPEKLHDLNTSNNINHYVHYHISCTTIAFSVWGSAWIVTWFA